MYIDFTARIVHNDCSSCMALYGRTSQTLVRSQRQSNRYQANFTKAGTLYCYFVDAFTSVVHFVPRSEVPELLVRLKLACPSFGSSPKLGAGRLGTAKCWAECVQVLELHGDHTDQAGTLAFRDCGRAEELCREQPRLCYALNPLLRSKASHHGIRVERDVERPHRQASVHCYRPSPHTGCHGQVSSHCSRVLQEASFLRIP